MLLLTHITIALASIVQTTYLLIRPSQKKFYVSYALVGLTIASGSYLIIASHAKLLPACEAGLTYLGIMTVGIVLSHIRFNRQVVKLESKDKNSAV